MNVAGIRRNIKNLAHNYTEAQVKVREATSNDPWGPPSTLMSEISDLTYNVVAFSEIMQMIWKRLNDHGKNYRHVYKALVLLDYLVKTGNEKVAQQCKENIYAIHTLRDFQHYEEGKDQGVNVREKAKQLEALLKDEERLKNERAKALKARERFAQQTTAFGFGSDSNIATSRSESFGSDPGRSRPTFPPSDLDLARPQTAGEEELQLQLALAMSREEAEKEEERRRSDDVRLALAISQSQENQARGQQQTQQESHLLDLLEVNLSGPSAGWVDPWGTPAHPADPPAPAMPPRPKIKSDFPSPGARPPTDAWGMPVASSSPAQVDPWGSPIPTASVTPSSSNISQQRNDPWSPAPAKPASDPWSPQPPMRTAASSNDPWSPQGSSMQPSAVGGGDSSNGDLDEFEFLTNRNQGPSPLNRTMGNPSGGAGTFDMSAIDDALAGNTGAKPKKSPETFLGPNSNLVNLENLVPAKPSVPAANPFTLNSGQPNPFQQPPAPRPSINELRNQQNFGQIGGIDKPVMPMQPVAGWNAPPAMGTPMVQGMPVSGGVIVAPGQATSPTLNPFLA